MSAEVKRGQNMPSNPHCPHLAGSSLVANTSENATKTPITSPINSLHASVATQSEQNAPSSSQTEIEGLSFIRQNFKDQGIKNRATLRILMQSYRSSTLKQYNVFIKKWVQFCRLKSEDPNIRNIPLVLEFLRHLFEQGLSYSSINTARSSLSSIFSSPPVGENPLVIRFLRGIYNIKPNLPKYVATWDVSVVLKYIEKLSPVKYLSLTQLSHKLVTLLALVSGQRVQTLHSLKLEHCHLDREFIEFTIMSTLKHSSPSNKTTNTIRLCKYVNKKVCPVFCLRYYLLRTKNLRQNSQLFINPLKPHQPVVKSTLSRWIKLTLAKAGINTDIYTAHSTRSASTSAAAAASVDITKIMRAASWSHARTFQRFYKRETETGLSFGQSILQQL